MKTRKCEIMKTKVNLEFISKVYEMNEKMLDLANFWSDNEEALKDVSECKNHLSREFLRDLAIDTYNWYLALFDAYLQK